MISSKIPSEDEMIENFCVLTVLVTSKKTVKTLIHVIFNFLRNFRENKTNFLVFPLKIQHTLAVKYPRILVVGWTQQFFVVIMDVLRCFWLPAIELALLFNSTPNSLELNRALRFAGSTELLAICCCCWDSDIRNVLGDDFPLIPNTQYNIHK